VLEGPRPTSRSGRAVTSELFSSAAQPAVESPGGPVGEGVALVLQNVEPASAASARCRASTWPSGAGRSKGCSARTAPARQRFSPSSCTFPAERVTICFGEQDSNPIATIPNGVAGHQLNVPTPILVPELKVLENVVMSTIRQTVAALSARSSGRRGDGEAARQLER
jgi:hypothetical protein